MGKRHERTAARRAALQVLYSGEINEASPAQIIDDDLVLEGEDTLNKYGDMLVRGVEDHKAEIDALLVDTSENWTLDRMPVVDRCVLRLAVFEMMHVDAVPVSVTINEAVELAKDFGGEDESGRFVNGVLGRIARRLEAEGDIAPELDVQDDADSTDASVAEEERVEEPAEDEPTEAVQFAEESAE